MIKKRKTQDQRKSRKKEKVYMRENMWDVMWLEDKKWVRWHFMIGEMDSNMIRVRRVNPSRLV